MKYDASSAERSYRMVARAEAVADTGRRIIEAAAALFTERPYEEVTLQALGDHAGVTPQTIIRRFGSKDGLLRAAAVQKAAEIEHARTPEDPTDVGAALRLLAASYEEMGDLSWRCLCQEERLPVVREMLDRARASHRAWVERTFADLLPHEPHPEREKRITLLFAATDFYVWKLLRRDLGVGYEAALRRMEETVAALTRTFWDSSSDHADSAQLDSHHPNSDQTDPAQTDSAQLDSHHPNSYQTDSAQTDSAQPHPQQPGPAQPGHDPDPAQPDSAQPDSAQTDPDPPDPHPPHLRRPHPERTATEAS